MEFTRNNSVKESMGIGNIHLEAMDQLFKAYEDLPFVFKLNEKFQEEMDRDTNPIYTMRWIVIGTFRVKDQYSYSIDLEIDPNNNKYAMRGHADKSWRALAHNWFTRKRWQEFYDITMKQEATFTKKLNNEICSGS